MDGVKRRTRSIERVWAGGDELCGRCHNRSCMFSARPIWTVEYTVNDESRLLGSTSVQKELAVQSHPRVQSFACFPREGGWMPPTSVMIVNPLFLLFFAFGSA